MLSATLAKRVRITPRTFKHIRSAQFASNEREERFGKGKRMSRRDVSKQKTKEMVAQWEAEGDRYISYQNLVELDGKLTEFNTTRTKTEKTQLLSELTLTYFARFHNVLREESQWEKAAVETRLIDWPTERLTKEGFTLLNLSVASRGNLFQEKVFRFTKKSSDGNLPFHQFAVGDCVRITVSFGDFLSEDLIEGVLMDRRPKYLDISLNLKDSARLDLTSSYRLDAVVNKVTLDRQVDALQQFLTPTVPGTLGVSRSVRDIILYSYPNSMIQLANTPGGLRMALPKTDDNITMSINSGTDPLTQAEEEEEFRVINEALNKGRQMTGTQQVIRGRGAEDDASANQTLQADVTAPWEQLQQHLSITGIIAEAKQKQARDLDNLEFSANPNAYVPESAITPVEISEAVFTTNDRLKTMAETFTPNAAHKTEPYSIHEIDEAISKVMEKCIMNTSQRLALEKAISQTITLVQGPPGTGKTRTACAMLAAVVGLKKQRLLNEAEGQGGKTRSDGLKFEKILACAHSNVAADNLLEGLAAQGLNVVRLGKPVNIRSSLWNNTLDARLLMRPEWVEAKKGVEAAVYNHTAAVQAGSDAETQGDEIFQLGATKKKFTTVEEECVAAVLMEADIIVTTCIGAGAELLRSFANKEKVRFSTVLVDEAAQCMESASLPAIVLGCERLILVGDQNQLPPVVASPQALEHGLGVSLFARLAAGGMKPSLLNEQYRMHPKIAEFSSSRFYGGLVQTKVEAEDRPVPKGFNWPNPEIPVVFVDVSPDQMYMIDKTVKVKKSTDTVAAGDEGATITEATLFADSGITDIDGMDDRPDTFQPINGGFEDYRIESQTSFSNAAEAEVIMGIVRGFLKQGDTTLGQIGVISPYKAQVRLMADRFRAEGWVEQIVSKGQDHFKTDMEKALGISRPPVVSPSTSKGDKKFQKGDRGDKKEVTGMVIAQGKTARDKFAFTDKERAILLGSKEKDKGPSAKDTTARALLLQRLHSNFNQPVVKEERVIPVDMDEDKLAFTQAISMYSITDDKAEDDGGSGIGGPGSVEPKDEKIEVRSVDGFQGREKDLIVISSVRSNEKGHVGFLQDWRRLNVAVTRAKSGLIIVGDSITLRQERHWGAFVDWCMLEGCYVRQPMKGEVLASLYTVPTDNHISPQASTYEPRPIMPVLNDPNTQTSYTSPPDRDSNPDSDRDSVVDGESDEMKSTSAADRERDRLAQRQRAREERASH